MSRPFLLSELISFLKQEGCVTQFENDKDFTISGFSPISGTKTGTLSWTRSQIDWASIKAAVVICGTEIAYPSGLSTVIIPVDHPRRVFARVLQMFAASNRKFTIENTVKIGDNCKIGEEVYIGHYTVIGNNVAIGERTIIFSNVSIYDNSQIGNECIIHSGVVIGADGFGYEKDEFGELIKIIHIGGVVIEDNVEIGSNTCIDRGTLGNTIIHNNVKIDNLCHIAHNVEIGKNTAVTAQAMIGGSTKVGENCWIAPAAAIKDGLTIQEGATVGMGAVVIHDVEKEDIVAGVPAKSIKRSD